MSEAGVWITREESDTSELYGHNPYSRPIDLLLKYGLIVLDKPQGPTSNQVVAWIKDLLGVKKAGQTGTLDPNASGVLVILLENSVKLTPFFSKKDKEYVALMKLHADVDPERVTSALKSFEGDIEQIPPKRSAVARRPRKRRIYGIEVLEIDGRNVLFRVNCEAGTYIRTLCVDVGKKLGMGAHLQELRRIKVGELDEDRACTLHELRDAYELWKEERDEELLRRCILPVEFGLRGVKGVMVKDSAVNALCNGAQLHVGGISKLMDNIEAGERVAIYTLKGEIIALGCAELSSREILKKRKDVAIRILRVVMERDLYPKLWKKSEQTNDQKTNI